FFLIIKYNQQLQNAVWIGISVISELEFLSIIAASAMENQASLLSNDVIFQRVEQLFVLIF
ncbi:hypothetical protein, partial [Flavobacterium sp.]|uniref:hypothetical protein n=1 Tax=Flavobacterium sp. TaxID=239 RepID=UPI00374CBA52